jgi:hypothetical protein
VGVFTSGQVPYIVTNDGDQSRKAVELYVTSLRSAERQRRETSWTLSSSHMSDAAKHILVNVGGALRWDLDKVAPGRLEQEHERE